MAEVALSAEVREGTGKGVARKLRATGKVPGILYGRGVDPVQLAVDARALSRTLGGGAGSNVLIDLQVGDQTHLTLAREIDRDPIHGTIRHVDFMKIAHDETIVVDVPIHLDGDSPGVKEGGVLEHHLWQLHVECLPSNVPDRINVDVSALVLGETVHVSDVVAPEGVEILSDPTEIIVSCVVPQTLKVEAELEEPAPIEGEPAPTDEAGAQS